jgi:long-chain fatty acid transport protein
MPKKNLGIGITYRSEVHQKVTGGAQYETSPLVRMIFGNNLFQFSDVSGKLDLPAQILVGINYKPTEKWNLGVSAIHTMWSSYDALKVEFQNMQAIGLPSKTSEKNWKDVWRYQVGVEYKALDWLALRASYVYDETPIDGDLADYLLPTSDRDIFGVGAGFTVTENLAIDVNYSLLIQNDRTIASRQIEDGVLASETEDGAANLFGISFSYKF